MKRWIAIVLLPVFLVNTNGYYLVFLVNQQMVRKEMMAEIRRGVFHPDILLLRFVKPERDPAFKRIDRHEFTYNGRMYDIVREARCGNETLIYCLHDTREEGLLANYTLFLRNSGRSSRSAQDSALPAMLSAMVFQALTQDPPALMHDDGISVRYVTSSAPLHQRSTPPAPPPPETA